MRVLTMLTMLAVLTLFGCSPSDDRNAVGPYVGQLLVDGVPVEHAAIVFHPVNPAQAAHPKPRGTTAADGSFRLTTYDTADGAPVGEYLVTVELWLAGKTADAPASNRLSAKYAKPESSGIRITVTAGGIAEPIRIKK